jgi:IS5 family transposase
MSNQISFSEIEYRGKRKRTQKEKFLARMREIVPLKEWCDIIRPYYYVCGNGRQPIGLETMLRMYLVSQWYNLSDEATEDLIYESLSVRSYVGISGDAPDSTTLCKFRHILEEHKLTQVIFERLTRLLQDKKVMFKEGTIVDATIIEAPRPAKAANKSEEAEAEDGSEPETEGTTEDGAEEERMSATFKKRPYYGLKAHIGVDEASGLIHSVATSTAKTADIEVAVKVLHGEEKRVRGDSGFVGIEKREDICKKYQDGSGETEYLDRGHKKKEATLKKRSDIEFIINKKRKQIVSEADKEAEREKSKVRAHVEHPFCIIKHVFGFRKTRYKTISKTGCKLLMLFALANLLYLSRKKITLK